MKKKETNETGEVSDLVKKLQKAFLSDSSDPKKKTREGDADDRAFQSKLAALLERLSRPVTPKKDEDLKKLLVDSDEEEAAAISESPKSQKKKAAEQKIKAPAAKKVKKTESPKKGTSGSPALAKAETKQTPVEDPIAVAMPIEESVVAELPSEPLIVEDPVMEMPLVEEPAIAESVVEEAVVAESAEEEAFSDVSVPEEKPRHPLDNVIPLEDSSEDHTANAPTEVSAESTEAIVDNIPSCDRAAEAQQISEEEPDAASPEAIAMEESIEAADIEDTPIEDFTAVSTEPPAESPAEETPVDSRAHEQATKEAEPVKNNKTLLQPTVTQAQEPRESRVFRSPAPSSTVSAEPAPAPTVPKKAIQPSAASVITIKSPTQTSEMAARKEHHEDAIVIRPPAEKRNESEPIVIRPRKADKPAAVPQSTAPQNDAPIIIKIGKESAHAPEESTTRISGEVRTPNMEKEKSPIMPTEKSPKKPPSISAIKKADTPREPAESQEAASAKTAELSSARPAKAKPVGPAIALPRSASGAKKRTATKKADPEPTPTESDERLEEVLEDAPLSVDLPEEVPIDEPEEIAPPPQKMTLFQRRQKRKQEKEEEQLSTIDLICKRSGLTADDINLIFELGYENELGRLVGYETLKRLKTEHLRQVEKHDTHHYRTAMGYRGEEWTGTHREKVLAAYVHDRKRILARLILTVLLSALLFLVEMPQLIGAPLLSIAAAYPLLLPIVGMLLFTCVSLLSLQQIEAGLRSLFRFTPTPYSVSAVLPPLVLGYDLLALFARSPMPPANFTASLTFLAVAVCDVLRLACEMRTFQMLSTDDVKQMLSAAPPRKRKLRSGDKIVKIMNDDLGENLYQIKPGIRTVGFFRRSNTLSGAARPFTILLVSMLSLAALLGLFSSVYTASASSALSAALLVLLAATPVSAIVTYFYPLCHANRLLGRCNSALIGEESVQELGGHKNVIFPDTKLFTAERSTQLSIRAGDDFRTDLRLVSSLLRRLGGTAEQITNGTRPTREDPPISIVRIQDGGVEAMVDHSYHVLLGNAAFMQRGGIAIPRENSDAALRRADHVSLMYAAINGVLKFSYEIEYTADLAFEEQIRNLAEDDTSVAIHTYDPNLNREFVQKCRGEQADPVRVIKPGRYEENRPTELVDAVALTRGDISDLIPTLHAAKAISRVRRFGLRMQFIGSLIGSAAILLLVIFGKVNTASILPIAAYQCFWILVSLIATASELNRKNLHIM